MSKYIDLVLVNTDKFGQMIFAAPAFTNLQEGDRVICEGKSAPELEGAVVASLCINAEGEYADFFVKATNVEMPLRRVLKTARYKDLEWKEDKEDDAV